MTPVSGLVLPSHEEPLVRDLCEGIGGPVGAHARLQRRRGWWTAMRVLVALTVLTCTMGWAQKAQCRDIRNWSGNGGVYQYTRVCYSDVVALYGSEGLSSGRVPYIDQPVEYPVLIGAVMDLGARAARLAPNDDGGVHRSALFFDLTVLMLALGAVVTVICTGLTAGRRLWDAALVALAPTLVLHLGTNWDLVAVALASGAMLAWSRRRPGLAGVLIGLAAASKLYPVLFLVPLAALCWRTRQTATWLRTAGSAAASFVLVTIPFWLVSPAFANQAGSDGKFRVLAPSPLTALRHGGPGDFISALWPWREGGANGVMRFWHLNATRGADWDSLWLWLDKVRPGASSWIGRVLQWPFDSPPGPTPGHLNLVVAFGVALVTLGVVSLALLAPRRPRLPSLVFLEVVGFLLVNKVDSPQYTLWLTPLVALALPRWRLFLAWQASEIALTITRFQYFVGLGKDKAGVGYAWFATTVWVRDLLLLVIAGIVVRNALRPEHDPVRNDGLPGVVDDPAGGVLDGAIDRYQPPPQVQRPIVEPIGAGFG